MKLQLSIYSFVLLISSFANAQVFKFDYDNNQVVELPEENYVIISHATSYWDENSSSKLGVSNLATFARNFNITSLGAVHDDAHTTESEAAKYFIKPGDVDFIYFSDAGQHKLKFPNLKNIFMAGGNLTLCLCETIRDVVREGTSDGLNIVLVKDAIYDWKVDYDPMKEEYVDGFINKFFLPHFNCPWQNWHNFPDLSLPEYRLDVYFNGTFFNHYDLEPSDSTPINQLSKVINVRFVSSEDLQKTYEEIKK